MEPPLPNDAAVRATNDEAFAAKVSAVQKGYFDDPFVLPLLEAVVPDFRVDPPSRQPMINRGTYARVTFVRRCVSSLLSATPAGSIPQVVSFGAGYDTQAFCVIADEGVGSIRYVELDFGDVVQKKAHAIANSVPLARVFDGMTRGADGGLTATARGGSAFVLAACDLRDVGTVRACLRAAGIDFGAPTVFVSECVLVYMEPEASDALIGMAVSDFSGLRGFVNYEPIEPEDAFGKQMVQNVALRGSPLLGIYKYPTVQSQRERYHRLGWDKVTVSSMLDAFGTMLDPKDVHRINRIEMLDELEEWQFLMKHYCFVWARVGPPSLSSELEKMSW